MPVGGRLRQFVEVWKRITNDSCMLSIVAKGTDKISPEAPEDSGNERVNIPDASEELEDSIQLFSWYAKHQEWQPVPDLKQLNTYIYAPHFRMHTISSVLSTIEKGDCVQNRPAGCVLSCNNTYRQ